MMPILTAARTAAFIPAQGAPIFIMATLMLLCQRQMDTMRQLKVLKHDSVTTGSQDESGLEGEGRSP